MPGAGEGELEELRSEIEKMKFAMVTREDYDNLQQELQKTQSSLKQTKQELQKQIKDLMEEIDEEKKIRATTAIEMERIKKLVGHC